MLAAIEAVLLDLRPDWVLVYGDTNSTAAAALAAAKLPTRLAHVEAGLRSFNRLMPEEINRVVADHLSHLCFAPTDAALANLGREGIVGDRVVRTGDVMFDAVRLFSQSAPPIDEIIPDLELTGSPFELATIHRAENTDDLHRLGQIVAALEQVAASHAVVLPLHPRTALTLTRRGLAFERVHTTGPVGYLEMLALERHASVVVTDSGGVQKEAYFQRTPCVTLRTETEWIELVEAGWNHLADPTDASQMVKAVAEAFGSSGAEVDLYGDGHSAEKIVDALVSR
jgi:UDP-GlcNAc3NAcA epimerase